MNYDKPLQVIVHFRFMKTFSYILMKILSWNILAEEFIDRKYYPDIPDYILFNREYRISRIVGIIKEQKPDIICLQEVMHKELNSLKSEIHGYNFYKSRVIKWVYDDVQMRSTSFNVILIRKKYRVKEIIELPTGIGIRIQDILILSIHLHDIDQSKRNLEMKELLSICKEYQQVIICGDFNQENINVRGYITWNTDPTYIDETEEVCIDNILTKGIHSNNECNIIHNNGSQYSNLMQNGSDHLPVVLNF